MYVMEQISWVYNTVSDHLNEDLEVKTYSDLKLLFLFYNIVTEKISAYICWTCIS
jgi:hypothetical protein